MLVVFNVHKSINRIIYFHDLIEKSNQGTEISNEEGGNSFTSQKTSCIHRVQSWTARTLRGEPNGKHFV